MSNFLSSFLTHKLFWLYKKKEPPKPQSTLPAPFQHIGLEEYLHSMLHKTRSRNMSLEELIFFPEIYDMHPDIPFWYDMRVTSKKKLLKAIDKYLNKYTYSDKCFPIMNYINEYNFVEIYLENFALTSKNVPKQIFSCLNLRTLSLKNNCLTSLSPEVGRLWGLRILVLSGNRIVSDNLPYTLTLCVNLVDLYLDNNFFTVIPAFLLKMKNLTNVNARNNVRFETAIKNCQLGNRIEQIGVRDKEYVHTVKSLVKLSVSGIALGAIDYFWVDDIVEDYQNLISDCLQRPICDVCFMPRDENEGYTVSSLTYGKFSKQWTPIAHYACSKECSKKLFQQSILDELVCVEQFVDERYSRKIQRRTVRRK